MSHTICKIIYTIVFSLTFTGAFAADPCAEYSAKAIDTVELGPDHKLIACGQNEGTMVLLATVLEVEKQKAKPLFVSHDSLKSYTFQKIGSDYIIKESLNHEGALPFVEKKISCTSKACVVSESCLWKKEKLDESGIGSVEMQITRKPANVSDDQLQSLFYVALNGSKRAQNLLATPFLNVNVAGTDVQTVFREDMARLKKINCL